MSSPQVTWDTPVAGSVPPVVKWDDEKQNEKKPTLLSNLGLTEGPDVQITDYPHAALSGVQSIGRGLRGAVKGIGQALDPNPQEGEPILPQPGHQQLYRLGKGLYDTTKGATEVPAAIHDINQSPDPTGTYLKAAQETAGQGAGQALVALGTEGVTRAVPPVVRGVSSAAKPVLRGVGKIATVASESLDPDLVGLVSPRAANGIRYAAKVGRVASKLGKEPAVAPISEPAPAPIPREVEQARGLATGAQPIRDPAAALERIPVRNETPAPIARPSKTIPRNVITKRLDAGLSEGLGAGVPEGHTPVESTAVKSFKYDPEAHELHVQTKSGVTYVQGEVSQAQADAFANAESKGRAWKAIRDNNPPVAKIIGGKRIAVKPSNFRSVTPTTPAPEEGLTPLLQKSLEKIRASRIARRSQPIQ